MKPGKKYVASDGNQYAMYPNPIMNITQTINGATSHRGTNAIDDAQADIGIANGYAPCDMVCVATDYVNGNAIFWQSKYPVWTLRYGLVYIYIMVIHDNTANAYVGMEIPQGTQLFSEGTAGNANGNHNHIEVGIGQYPGYMYVKSGYLTEWGTTVYMMPGNVDPSDVFFVDDTQIINGGGLLWKTTDAISVRGGGNTESYVVEEEHYAIRFTYDQIRIRKDTPDGEVVGYVNTGDEVEYFAKTVYNGHRWVRDNKNQWYAISNSEERGKDMWGELIDPSEMKVNQKPDEPSEPVEPSEPETPEEKPDDSEFSDNVEDPNFLEEPDLADELLETQYGLTIVHNLEVKKDYPIKCPFTMKSPKGVVIHNAGSEGNPSAETLNKSMLDTTEERSWHFSVDESNAVQGLPLNRNNWSIGDGLKGEGNRNYISIEICRDMYGVNGGYTSTNQNDEVDPNWEKACENGALLAAILLNKYGWDINHLKKHHDFEMSDGKHKYCPHHILNDGWDDFVTLVQEKLNEIQNVNNPSKEEKEGIDYGLVNKILEWVLKLLKKIVGIFK